MIPLKIPHLLRCIRAESLKLKVVDYDRSLSFELLANSSALHPEHFERNPVSGLFAV